MKHVWWTRRNTKTLNIGDATFQWNYENQFSIPESEFTDDQLTFLRGEYGFIVGAPYAQANAVFDNTDDTALLAMLDPVWINGPIDLNTLINPGVYIIAGEFLNGNGDPQYHVPGNTGMMRLQVTKIPADPNGGVRVEVIQQYLSVDGADKGGQRRRFNGTWNGWMKY
jgi:hypothetical protein